MLIPFSHNRHKGTVTYYNPRREASVAFTNKLELVSNDSLITFYCLLAVQYYEDYIVLLYKNNDARRL